MDPSINIKCKIQKNWCTVTVAPTIEHHGGHCMDPCKPEVRLGAREESASPAWLAAAAMNTRDTTKVYIWRLDTGCGPTHQEKGIITLEGQKTSVILYIFSGWSQFILLFLLIMVSRIHRSAIFLPYTSIDWLWSSKTPYCELLLGTQAIDTYTRFSTCRVQKNVYSNTDQDARKRLTHVMQWKCLYKPIVIINQQYTKGEIHFINILHENFYSVVPPPLCYVYPTDMALHVSR